MDYFKFLPSEITLDILSRVPTESVVECKSVCKTWNNLVSHHPLFRQTHIHHHLNHPAADSGKLGFLALTNMINENSIRKFQYFELSNENQDLPRTPIEKIRRVNFATPITGEISFHGSSNGLICFSESQSFGLGEEPICICNPITKEYVMLPKINRYCCDAYWRNAFGYVSSTNEYKVVGIMLTNEFVDVHIYTLGSGNGWRNIGKFYSEFSPPWQHPTFVNEAVYWMDGHRRTILAFDLSGEKFCENLSPPPCLPADNSDWYYNSIGVLDGFLYFAAFLAAGEHRCYDIWVLKTKNDKDGMKEQEEHQSWVWSKEFRIKERILLAVTKSGGVLTYNSFNFNLYMYDTKALASKVLVEFNERFSLIYPHKNTLVSLKELGEKDTKIFVSVGGNRKPRRCLWNLMSSFVEYILTRTC